MSTRADEIEIPDRIERRPTDILKAISSTLTTDYTAPHYRFNKIDYSVLFLKLTAILLFSYPGLFCMDKE